MLYEMHSILYWSSLIETGAFILAILFWVKLSDQMGIVLLFIPSFLRGIFGLIINKKFPKSHDIIEKL